MVHLGRKIGTAVVVLAVLLLTLLFLQQARYNAFETRVIEAFFSTRENLALGSGSFKNSLVETHPSLFKDCSQRTQYEQLIDADSRTLSETELTEALTLHDICGDYFFERDDLALTLIKKEVEKLVSLSLVLEQAADDPFTLLPLHWQTLQSLENEHNQLYKQNIDIQQQFWEIELQKQRGEINAEEREELISALNTTGALNNNRLAEIQSERREVAASEQALWASLQNEYSTKKQLE